MHVYQSYNSGSAPALQVDRLWVYPDLPDIRQPRQLHHRRRHGRQLDHGELGLRRRRRAPACSCARAARPTAAAWSAWSAPLTARGQTITSPDQRYLQYRVELHDKQRQLARSSTRSISASAASAPEPPTATPTNTSTPRHRDADAQHARRRRRTPTPTPTTPPATGNVTHSTAARLGRCATYNGTHADAPRRRRVEPGRRVRRRLHHRASTRRWTAGAWAGGAYTPTVSGGALTVAHHRRLRALDRPRSPPPPWKPAPQFGSAAMAAYRLGRPRTSTATATCCSRPSTARPTCMPAPATTAASSAPTLVRSPPACTPTASSARATRCATTSTARCAPSTRWPTCPPCMSTSPTTAVPRTTLQVDRLWTYPDLRGSRQHRQLHLDGGTGVNWTTREPGRRRRRRARRCSCARAARPTAAPGAPGRHR